MKLLQKIERLQNKNLPFVAFKKPKEDYLHLMHQENQDLFEFDDFTKKGYVFAPFDDESTAYLLQPDVVDKEFVFFEEPEETEIVIKKTKEQATKHIEKVAKAIVTIQTTDISKIVLSRKEEITIDEKKLAAVFKKLLLKYQNAYVYFWYHPKVGVWMGATPETLLSVDKNKFKTMSLAGTQPFLGTTNPTWGVKELEEQQMVSDYIKDYLQNSVNHLSFSEVETVKAGNLLHLKTTITGELKAKEDVEQLVKYLHPTPAVCGLPKQKAKNYILKNEGYNRSFYAGYLGAINIDGCTDLFVNLRCFSIIKKVANLYVGGGITAQSIAEKEWIETVKKSETIKSVLN